MAWWPEYSKCNELGFEQRILLLFHEILPESLIHLGLDWTVVRYTADRLNEHKKKIKHIEIRAGPEFFNKTSFVRKCCFRKAETVHRKGDVLMNFPFWTGGGINILSHFDICSTKKFCFSVQNYFLFWNLRKFIVKQSLKSQNLNKMCWNDQN